MKKSEKISGLIVLALAAFFSMMLVSCPKDTETADPYADYIYSYSYKLDYTVTQNVETSKPGNVVLVVKLQHVEDKDVKLLLKDFKVSLNGSEIYSKDTSVLELEKEDDADSFQKYLCCIPESFDQEINIEDNLTIELSVKADRKIFGNFSFYLIDSTPPAYWRELGELKSETFEGPDKVSEDYQTLSEEQKEISFQKKNYVIDKAYEFNDEDKFEEEWAWTPYTANSDDGLTRKDNVIVKCSYPEAQYVKDGSLHMIEKHYEESGTAYCSTTSIYNHIVHWSGEKSKNPYGFNQGLIEIKFKAPKDEGVSFAIFPSDVEAGWSYSGERGFYNDDGYNFTEIDLCEYIPGGEGIVEPHGGLFISNKNHKIVCSGSCFFDEDGNYLYSPDNWLTNIKIDENTWYDDWHTLKAIWEDYQLVLYYDDIYYKTFSWDQKYGNPKGDYGFQITPQYANWFDSEIDWNDTKEHDFQIDYIRVYKEVK